jgi:hypothetical protein
VPGIRPIVPSTKTRYQKTEVGSAAGAAAERGRGGGWHADSRDPDAEDRRSRRAPGRAARVAPRARHPSDHRILEIWLGAPVMPPDDTIMPAILPEPPARGAEKFTVPLPAGASPEDVRHWFDLETIAELPAPVASFADAADAAAQYRRASRAENTRRAYRAGVARFTEWCAAHGRGVRPVVRSLPWSAGDEWLAAPGCRRSLPSTPSPASASGRSRWRRAARRQVAERRSPRCCRLS